MNAGARDFLRRDAFGRFDEFGIMRRAQADVVRKNHRANNVVVPVNGINAIEQRNFQPRLQRLRVKFIHALAARSAGELSAGIGTAAAQHRAEKIFLNIGFVLQREHVRLHHLADFFVERHLREEFLRLRFGARGVQAKARAKN